MKSFKPGRGPSFMGGLFMLFFAVVAGGMAYTVSSFTSSFGVPSTLSIFVLVPAGMAVFGVIGAIYNFVNALGKNRFSDFDITDENEEPDPLNERLGGHAETPEESGEDGAAYCPYCGTQVEEGYLYCKKCGKKLPT